MSKILIIEDDASLTQLLGLALFREGFEAHYAFNGLEGYDKILSLQPDVVLLDLMLPGLNGVEVLRRLSTNTLARDIPVIIMTGYGDRPDLLEEKLLAYGAREYLRKPFPIKSLVSSVKRIIAQYPRQAQQPHTISKGVVSLDTQFRTLKVGERIIGNVSRLKVAVLRLMIEAKGPVRREKLIAAAWRRPVSGAALDKAIQRLREDLGPEARRIQTSADGYELIGAPDAA